MNTEWTHGIIAEVNSANGNQHVGLTYVTDGDTCIIFTVIATDLDNSYHYWGQWETKEDATSDYDVNYNKLFNNK